MLKSTRISSGGKRRSFGPSSFELKLATLTFFSLRLCGVLHEKRGEVWRLVDYRASRRVHRLYQLAQLSLSLFLAKAAPKSSNESVSHNEIKMNEWLVARK